MKKAFTLIELLVVIAIIAILAGLLFPVFARAKEQAKTAATLSNVKQLGMALFLYAADHDDAAPNVTEGWVGQGVIGGWMTYSAFASDTPARFEPEQGSLWPYVKGAGIFRSELDPSVQQARNSFAINGCFAEPVSRGLLPGRSLSVSQEPASQMLFAEEKAGDFGTNDGFLHPYVDAFAEWHNGGNAMVFADGHAKIEKVRGRYEQLIFGNGPSCWPEVREL